MIRSSATLTAALAKCSGGETIDEGVQIDGRVALSNIAFDRPVTILGARIAQAAPLRGLYDTMLRLTNCTGLIFDGLDVRGQAHATDVYRGQAVSVQGGRNVTIRRSSIMEAWGGITARAAVNLTLDRNDIHFIRTDGFIGQDMVDFTATANWFKHWFTLGDPEEGGDHGDAIQLHSNNNARDDTDGAMISDNLFDFVLSDRAQCVWPADPAFGGHRRVRILRNLCFPGLQNVLTSAKCVDAELADNVIMIVEGSPYRPWIRTDGTLTRLLRNASPAYKLAKPSTPIPAGNLVNRFYTQIEIDAARSDWLAQYRAPPVAVKPTLADLRAKLDEVQLLLAAMS